jgi:ferredoxin
MSTGNCVRRAPQAFKFNEDDVAVVQDEAAAQLSDEELLQIARGCPVGAISLVTETGDDVDIFS